MTHSACFKAVRLLIGALAAVSLFTACAPKIYVIDRQTVLEDEAAGHWPEFDKEVVNGAKAAGPTPFPKVPPNARRNKLYSILSGPLQ